jgi:hypothetical protein
VDYLIRELSYRVEIQKKDKLGNKFYPTLISASTTDQYPFSIPTADISVVTNSTQGTNGYSAPVTVDDHIRLQVCVKNKANQKTAWKDIFQGTIQETAYSNGPQNKTSLHCVGYMDEVSWTLIEETKSWSTTTDARDIFGYLINDKVYHRRLIVDPTYALSGVTYTNYNTSIGQNYLSDVVSDMEKYSGYTYRASALPVYDVNRNLNAVYLSWKPLSTIATDKYKVIEGTTRYISSEFSSSIEDLINQYTVDGSSDVVGNYHTSIDSPSVALYGKRAKVDSFNWIDSILGCTKIADSCLSDLKDAHLSGSAVLIGTPDATVGDLVYCKSPSQKVAGSPINTNMTVYRVAHNISADGKFTTALNLGRIYKTEYDRLSGVIKAVSTTKKNTCKR